MIGRTATALGALVLLGAMFADWYRFDIEGTALGGVRSVDAWGAFQWIDMVLVVAVVSGLASAVAGARVAVVGRPWFAAAAGTAASVAIVYRWAEPPVEAGSTGFATVTIGVEPGLYLGLAGAVLLAAAGAFTFSRRT